MMSPEASHCSLHRKATSGVTSSGFKRAAISSGKTPWANLVAASGATALMRMLYFTPSSFSEFMKPTMPSLAAA